MCKLLEHKNMLKEFTTRFQIILISSVKPLFTFSSAVYLQFLNLQKGNVIWLWLQKHFSNLVANRAINNRSVFLQKYFECTYVLISKKYVCCCKTTLKKNHGNIFNKTSTYTKRNLSCKCFIYDYQ